MTWDGRGDITESSWVKSLFLGIVVFDPTNEGGRELAG